MGNQSLLLLRPDSLGRAQLYSVQRGGRRATGRSGRRSSPTRPGSARPPAALRMGVAKLVCFLQIILFLHILILQFFSRLVLGCKYAFDSMFRVLQHVHTSAPLKTLYFLISKDRFEESATFMNSVF